MKSRTLVSLVFVFLAYIFVGSTTLAQEQRLTPQQQQLFDEGARLYATAHNFYSQQKTDDALKPAQRALEIFLQLYGENASQTADARNLVGNVLMGQFKYEPALEEFKKVLEIRKVVFGERSAEAGAAWFNLGVFFSNQEKHDESMRYLQHGLEIFRETKGQNSTEAMKVLSRIALVQRQKGDLRASAAGYREVLEVVRSNPKIEASAEGWTLRSLAEIYEDMMDYSASLKTMEQALPIFRRAYGEESSSTASFLSDLGVAYVLTEDYVTGRKYLERGLEIRLKLLGPNHYETAKSYVNLGGMLNKLGDIKTARAYLEKAVQIYEATLGMEHTETAFSYNNLGHLLDDLGETRAAQEYFEKSLAIHLRVHGADHPDTAAARMALGSCLTFAGKPSEARKQFEQALATHRKFANGEHLGVSNVLNNLADCLEFLGDHEEAIKCYREAVRIRRQLLGDERPSTLSLISNLAFALESTRNSEESVQLIDEARRGVRKYVTRFLPHLSESEQLGFLANEDEKRFQISMHIAWLHRDDPAITARSAEWLINGKAVAQESLAAKALLRRDASNPQLKELARVRGQLAALSFSAPASGQEESRRQELMKLEADEQRLARQVGDLDTAKIEAPWVELEKVRAAIAMNAAFVDIVQFHVFNVYGRGEERKWLPSRYAAWIVPPSGKGEVKIVDLGEVDVIDQAVQKTRSAIEQLDVIHEQGEAEAEKAVRQASAGLRDRVLLPIIAALPKETESILLSPDGELWLAPWAALPLADDKFALEKYEFHLFISGRDLLSRKTAARATTNPVIVADPDFDLSPQDSLAASKAVLRNAYRPAEGSALRTIGSANTLPKVSRLPGTAEEARSMTAPLTEYAASPAVVYSEKYAQEAIVKVIQRPKALVLSTHGFFLEDKVAAETERKLANNESSRSISSGGNATCLENPLLRCGLLLSGCNANVRVAGGDDGVLTGLEICDIDLRGTELVVLSACQSGQGQVRNGEGVAGLRQAFQLAGAQAVVSSLWQVPDRDSALIMSDFVAGLAAGKSQGKALRDAQLRRIAARRERNGAAHPLFWGAWTLTGRPPLN